MCCLQQSSSQSCVLRKCREGLDYEVLHLIQSRTSAKRQTCGPVVNRQGQVCKACHGHIQVLIEGETKFAGSK